MIIPKKIIPKVKWTKDMNQYFAYGVYRGQKKPHKETFHIISDLGNVD